MSLDLDRATAERLARIALGHVTREYPNKLDHVLAGPGDLQAPRDLHPIFYGSFDWHSCVHAYWTLARLLRRFPDFAAAAEIAALFDASFTPDKVAGELAYLARPAARGFERPYGWAWLLRLAAELAWHPDRPWAVALAPLAEAFADRFRAYLPLATYPVRAGTHGNSAFALLLATDYAEPHDPPLLALLRAKAADWYGGDRDCQAWEPGGDDFLSPALVEALCMRRLLAGDAFEPWLAGFLPRLGESEPATLFRPATVTDKTDGKLVHLVGLNLARAWCWRSLAAHWSRDDPRRPRAERAAEAHLAAGLPAVTGDYMAEHWLTTFAVLALDC